MDERVSKKVNFDFFVLLIVVGLNLLLKVDLQLIDFVRHLLVNLIGTILRQLIRKQDLLLKQILQIPVQRVHALNLVKHLPSELINVQLTP